MTTRIVTAAPAQTLEAFAHSVLVTHHFKALPVIDDKGTLLAMVSVGHLRSVPKSEWHRITIDVVMDRQVRTLCPEHSAADADAAFRQTPYDYIPIVNPRTTDR